MRRVNRRNAYLFVIGGVLAAAASEEDTHGQFESNNGTAGRLGGQRLSAAADGHIPQAVTVVLSGETLVITLHGALSLTALVRAKIQQASLADVDGRGLPRKLRDGVARLFSPYL